MEFLSKSTKNTKKLAKQLVPKIKSGSVIALYGDLGSGKTTFVKYLVEALGSKARIQSPTFVLIKTYKIMSKKIQMVNHIDLYRIENIEELKNLGIEELIKEPKSVTLIEWPKIAEKILPVNTIKIYFEYVGENTRKISCEELNVQNIY